MAATGSFDHRGGVQNVSLCEYRALSCPSFSANTEYRVVDKFQNAGWCPTSTYLTSRHWYGRNYRLILRMIFLDRGIFTRLTLVGPPLSVFFVSVTDGIMARE